MREVREMMTGWSFIRYIINNTLFEGGDFLGFGLAVVVWFWLFFLVWFWFWFYQYTLYILHWLVSWEVSWEVARIYLLVCCVVVVVAVGGGRRGVIRSLIYVCLFVFV